KPTGYFHLEDLFRMDHFASAAQSGRSPAGIVTVMGTFIMDAYARVERFPLDGETVLSLDAGSAPGGKGVNQAVAAARQGASVRMLGAVGDDEDGKRFLRLLLEEKIDAGRVLISKDAATGKSMIMVDGRAENRIVVIPGANHRYSIEDLNKATEAVASSALAMIQLEMRREVNEQMLRVAREADVPVVLNPAPASKIDRELACGARYFTPNIAELAYYSGMRVESAEDARAAVKKLLADGFKTVVATLGDGGAAIGDADGVRVIPGYRVAAVDTVGAGDAFNGAFAARLIAGDDIERAVRYANAAGALSVTGRGAIPSIPNRAEVLEFMERAGETA
ncbi:MAG TPA: ribokinase, partial [Feifaniaceae bacterium]|nr:ribokinase [Feifaniaceae bacterium]